MNRFSVWGKNIVKASSQATGRPELGRKYDDHEPGADPSRVILTSFSNPCDPRIGINKKSEIHHRLGYVETYTFFFCIFFFPSNLSEKQTSRDFLLTKRRGWCSFLEVLPSLSTKIRAKPQYLGSGSLLQFFVLIQTI